MRGSAWRRNTARAPAMPGLTRSLPEERLVTARLDVVAIGVAHERAVVVLVIVRPRPRLAVVLAACRLRRRVEVAHELAPARADRGVDRLLRCALSCVEPEVWVVVRTEPGTTGELRQQAVAERCECLRFVCVALFFFAVVFVGV